MSFVLWDSTSGAQLFYFSPTRGTEAREQIVTLNDAFDAKWRKDVRFASFVNFFTDPH